MDTPQKRLELFINQVFKTKTNFATFLNVHPTWVSKYTGTGTSVIRDYKIISHLAEKRFNYEWYLTGNGEMLLPEQFIVKEPETEYNVDISDFLEIEVYDIPANANQGSLVSFYDLPFSTKKLALSMKLNPKLVKGIRITGNSMIDAGLRQGGIVVYDTSLKPKNNDIIVCILNNVILVKKYIVNIIGVTELHSAFNGIEPIVINEIDDNLTIMGVVKVTINYPNT